VLSTADDEENGLNSSWLRSVERMNRQIAGEKEPKHGHPSTRLQAMMDAAAGRLGLSRLAGSKSLHNGHELALVKTPALERLPRYSVPRWSKLGQTCTGDDGLGWLFLRLSETMLHRAGLSHCSDRGCSVVTGREGNILWGRKGDKETRLGPGC